LYDKGYTEQSTHFSLSDLQGELDMEYGRQNLRYHTALGGFCLASAFFDEQNQFEKK